MERPSKERLEEIRAKWAEGMAGQKSPLAVYWDLNDLFAEIDALTRELDEAWLKLSQAHELRFSISVERDRLVAQLREREATIQDMRTLLRQAAQWLHTGAHGVGYGPGQRESFEFVDKAEAVLAPPDTQEKP